MLVTFQAIVLVTKFREKVSFLYKIFPYNCLDGIPANPHSYKPQTKMFVQYRVIYHYFVVLKV